MKITNDAQMQQALEQMNRMYRVIASFKKEVQPLNARNYEIMIEGPLNELRRLQAQIDEYLEITGRIHQEDNPPQHHTVM